MKVRWKWYVYIIECKDEFYYTGLTWKPDLRWMQHLSRFGSKFTAKHKPKKVVYLEEYDNLEQARKREKQIKGWTREKKEKLIKYVYLLLILFFLTIFSIRLFAGEDDWICQDGQWVRHGKPSMPMPETSCIKN